MSRIDKSIDKALDYIFSTKKNGGFPAVKASDQSGIWTTSETLGILATLCPQIGSDYFVDIIDFILGSQIPGEGWYLIGGPPSSTMSTADTLVAFQQLKKQRLVPIHLVERVEKATTEGLSWLLGCQNKDGGWGIEHKPYTEEGQSRIYSTYYALRTLNFMENIEQDILLRGINFVLSNQNNLDGSWGCEYGEEGNISSTSRAIQLLVTIGKYQNNANPVQNGLNYILNNKDHLVDDCNSEELITRPGGLFKIDNFTSYDLLNGLLTCHYADIKVLQLLRWFLKTQNLDGHWNLQCQCNNKKSEASSWVTNEILIAISKARTLFYNDHKYLLQCFFSLLSDSPEKKEAIESLSKKDFWNYDNLIKLTPEIVINSFPSDFLNSAFIDDVYQSFEYICIPDSDEASNHRFIISTSWESIAQNSTKLQIKAKSYFFALKATHDLSRKRSINNKPLIFELLLSLKEERVPTFSSSDISKIERADVFDHEFQIITALWSLINEIKYFEDENDPTIASIRVGKSLTALNIAEDLIIKSPDICSLVGIDFFSSIKKRIETRILLNKDEAKPFVSSELTGIFKEGIASTLIATVRINGLPVKNVNFKIKPNESFHISHNERSTPTLGAAGCQFEFTIIPQKQGTIIIPICISYIDLDSKKHEINTEHEISAIKSSSSNPKKLTNQILDPYSYGSGVLTDKMFFGREQLIEDMINSVTSKGSTPQSFALLGQRRIGKTSFLKALKRKLDINNIITVFIDLEMVLPRTQINFLGKLNEELMHELSGSKLKDKVPQKNILLRIGEALSQIKEFEFMQFKLHMDKPEIEYLQLAYTQFAEKLKNINAILAENDLRCVVLLDEMGEFAKYKESEMLLGFMRGLIQELSMFSFIVAGPDILFELTSEDNFFFNIFKKEKLVGLDEKEVKSLMTIPIPQVEFEEEMFSYVYQFTKGNPYYIQAICKGLISILNNEKRSNTTIADLKYVITKLVDDLDDQSRFQWKDTNKSEHILLASIASFESQCDSTQVQDKIISTVKNNFNTGEIRIDFSTSFQRLQEKGYIVKSGTNYSLADEFFRRWIISHHPLLNILKEEAEFFN